MELSGCDGERYEEVFCGTLTCRKPFKCGECRREVGMGGRYEKFVGEYDGEFATHRTCAVCVEIRMAFSGPDGWLYANMWEDLQDYGFPEMNESCFDRLQTVAAKKYLRERWMEWKGLKV